VLSHLRWTFVWQRPQHLVSRIAGGYDRTWFVEEPMPVPGLRRPRMRTEPAGAVTRLWLEVPDDDRAGGFDAASCERYTAALGDLVEGQERTAWLYTPMALSIARALRPTVLVYDVMDDLAAFRHAPTGLVLRQRQALREADVVFTGGRSLQRSVEEHRRTGASCFPSGVEPDHFAAAIARRARRNGSQAVAGYVGVIDERIDLELVAGLAAALPDWQIRMVGPVVKIDPASLPQAPNLAYPGSCPYAELPDAMGDFDVALMPFALNDATRSISPTKTLEYLAAGLPVVSTRVPDVVADYRDIVDLRDDGRGFADACLQAQRADRTAHGKRVAQVLDAQHWDTIASRMSAQLATTRNRIMGARETA
jgi:glycosyltransferase involved in cell wall biosynthesis